MPGERDTFLEIRPKLTQFRDDSGNATADLDVDPNDAKLAQKIVELRDQGIIEEIRAGGILLSRSTPLSGLVTLTINTANVPGYFETWTHLIQRHPLIPPADYDVFDRTDGNEASYHSACELLRLLKQRAEVWDATQLRFFLVDRQAIEIPITYTMESAASIAEYLRAVTAFLDPKHIEADSRWNFFRKAAIRVIQDTVQDARLSVMFTQLGNIIERANQDFSLYLERYSFEDALKGFDEKRLKFIADLNQVLASVQAALLAVPVGFFLVAEKIKQSPGWNGQNVIIGAGGVIFCGILLVLLRNQGRTLKEVQKAIDEFGTAQKAKNTPNALQIEGMVQTARKHSGRIRFLLRVVTGFVILFAGVIVAAVVWASKPEIQKVIPYASAMETTLPTAPTAPGALTPKATVTAPTVRSPPPP